MIDTRPYAWRKHCALCYGQVGDPVLSLGETPLANEFVSKDRPQTLFPLSLVLCKQPACRHLQLRELVPPRVLFDNYLYESSTSPVFVRHFTELASHLFDRLKLSPDSAVVDVGSNDGVLLNEWSQLGLSRVVGIEPASRLAVSAEGRGLHTIVGYLDNVTVDRVRETIGLVDLVTANNLFAHMPDLRRAALDIKAMLKPGGHFVFEVSYLADVVRDNLFDTIYHEHTSYHTIRPLIPFFHSLGMSLIDVEKVPTHGGSVRVYVVNTPDEASVGVDSLIAWEEEGGLFEDSTYQSWRERILEQGISLRTRLEFLKESHFRFCGFGAPAKLTTLMYTLGLNPADFAFIVDDSSSKQGLMTPGMHVPVVPSDALLERGGENWACLVFAWNFYQDIVKKHSNWPGVWINPVTAHVG